MAYDSSGSYNSTFYMSGAFIVVSGVMLTALPAISRWERRRRRRKLNLDTPPLAWRTHRRPAKDEAEVTSVVTVPTSASLSEPNMATKVMTVI
jgi:hypothetical protein